VALLLQPLLPLVRAMVPAVAPFLSPRRLKVTSVRLVPEHVGMGLVSVCPSVSVFPCPYKLPVLHTLPFIPSSPTPCIVGNSQCRYINMTVKRHSIIQHLFFYPDDGGNSVLPSIPHYFSLHCLTSGPIAPG
jgi:hypothetical protein